MESTIETEKITPNVEQNETKQLIEEDEIKIELQKKEKAHHHQHHHEQFHPMGTVKVLSYNIFIRPPLIKNNRSDHKDERLALFINSELRNWDVIGFQEMFAAYSGRQKHLIEAAKQKGLEYHVRSPSPPFLSKYLVDGGLLILSRFPMVKTGSVIFSQSIQSDALAAKGAIHAKIEIKKGVQVHFFNTHLQASYNDPRSLRNFQLSEEVRAAQIREFKEFIYRETKDDNDPIVLLGDLNVNGRKSATDHSDSDEYIKMIEMLSEPYFDLKDVLKETAKMHPATVGDIVEVDGEILAKEVHLTRPVDQKLAKRLDYIFWVDRKATPPTSPSETSEDTKEEGEDTKETKPSSSSVPHHPIRIVENSCKVAHLFVDEEFGRSPKAPTLDSLFTQLSDHYGVAIELEYQ